MAKGSVRKKGKKWYYRFYVEDASGNLVQKEFTGTESKKYGELYHRNYYRKVQDKNRVYYKYYSLENTQDIPADYNEISFVCLRPDGCLETSSTLSIVCRTLAKKLDGFEGFHFHQLRHTFATSRLEADVDIRYIQEMLGHSSINITEIYTHVAMSRQMDILTTKHPRKEFHI